MDSEIAEAPLSPFDAYGFLDEASARFGVSERRLGMVIQAAQRLSGEELAVVEKLLELEVGGVPGEHRRQLAAGLLRALEALAEAADDPLALVDDPLSPAEAAEHLAVVEGAVARRRSTLLEVSVGVQEAARLTRRSRQSLERLRRAGRLLALRVKSQWRYPAWQFDPDAPGGVLPGIDHVIGHLGLSPLGTAAWLTRPLERLGGKAPLELLRRHESEPVVKLAEEQGHLL